MKTLNRENVEPLNRQIARPVQQFNGSTVQRFNINITNRQRTRRIDTRLLRQIVQTLLRDTLAINRADLGICLVTAAEITRLNKTFLHHAGPTDVIAFDYSPAFTPVGKRGAAGRPKQGLKTLHGEIFICVEEALAQARRYRTSWQSELVRYLVHGLLHLCGYDDQSRADRHKMKQAEDRLLRQLSRQFNFAKPARAPRLRSSTSAPGRD